MSADDRLGDILADWRERQDRGEYLDPEEVIRAHPDVADRLRARFAALAAIDDVFATADALRPALPERIGPYRVIDRLGAGGMGTVYLGEAAGRGAVVEAGTRVALKLLHPHALAKPGFFKRFLREAELGKSVRHENVVRTLDVDASLVDGGQVSFLVMEYVEGRTLRALLQDLEVVPEPLVREIAQQAAAGLAAIHDAGIVHRDLKPENLLITDDHRVRIMDLGVARVTEEDSRALTAEGEFVGSLAYAAPEQFGKGDIGPPADLYSLGVLLYELATGVNPFHREGVAAVIAAHLNETPRHASDVHPEVSPFVAELLATLLRKSAADRFESAGSLGELLRDAERSAWWAERERALLEAQPRIPVVPVRRETPLYGREEDLALLRDTWARASGGAGGVVLLEGEAGIGKTRLVDAFLRELTDEDVHVLYGSYPPAGGMGGLSDAIVQHFGAARLEDALAPFLTQTPTLVPPLAALLTHASPLPDAPSLAGDALHAVICHLLRNLAADKPIVWVVDDLHFASADGRAVVLSMARAAASHPVLLVVTARPGLPEGELAHFGRLGHFRRTRLGRLSPREVIELLRDSLRSEALAEKLGGKIAYKSDGVPFFVFEMIRGLREGQFITQLPDGSWIETKVVEQIEVPSAVRDLIEARLRDLTTDERALLDVGAVQGFEFDPDLLARVLGRRRIHVLQALAEMERRSGIVRGGKGACRFDHHQIQEVIYADLMPDLRTEYHRLIAEDLEERQGVAAGEVPVVCGPSAHVLCHHFLAGGRPTQAERHLDAALDHLEATHQSDLAAELAARALSVPELMTDARRVDVLLRHADRLRVLARAQLEREALDEALTLAQGGDSLVMRAKVEAKLGWHLMQGGETERARGLFTGAIHTARESGDKALEARAAGSLSVVLARTGRYDEALAEMERHRGLATELGDRQDEGTAIGNIGSVYFLQGQLDEALRHAQRHFDISTEVGDVEGECRAAGNLGIACSNQGRYAEARTHQEHRLAVARRVGARREEAAALGHLGNVLHALGSFEEARAHQEKHLGLAREMGDPREEAVATGNLANVFHALGRYAEARDHNERKLRLARQIGDPRQEIIALHNLGKALTHLGEVEAGVAALRRSLELGRDVGTRWLNAHALWMLGERLQWTGQREEAARLFEEGVDALRSVEDRDGLAGALSALGALLWKGGRTREARERLEEAAELGRGGASPGASVLAECRLVIVSGGDTAVAVSGLDAVEERLDADVRMQARLLLWQATRDLAHLGAAYAVLEGLRDHAPEEYRDSMLENVPLHRDIMAAWREHGGSESETAVRT